ncbi:hypothetical protein FRC02_006823 [Tulasnella sp. 418]|nr:hypothetical protein FRC02_006823 [Tulasnella sp. 418]
MPTPSVTQVSDATSSVKPDQKSDDNSGFMVTDVRVCIWDRCLGGPEAITFLDKPSFELVKSYSGRTSINKILMDLENDERFSFRRTFRCYSPRDQEHNFTRPALRWSPREETRRIASLPKFGDITTIHVILDTSFFLLFILYAQPFQPARGIVVGMKNEQDSYNVEQYLLRGLCLTKGDLYYQEIEGDHRLQLTGCRLEPFSCDWCILRGRPKMDN